MRGFVKVAAAVCVAALGFAGQASAQAQGDRPLSIQLGGGAAFGTQASPAFGIEADYAVKQRISVFLEAAMVGNVAPSFVTDRANIVATALGGSVDAKDQATFGTIGVKYTMMPVSAAYRPYVGVGYTYGKIKKTADFTIGGTAVSEAKLLSDYGVLLGSDLAGSMNKGGVAVQVGVTRAIGERFGLDLSYRLNQFMAKTDDIENDKAINAQRVQLNVLIRF